MNDKLEIFAAMAQKVREIRRYGVVRNGARELTAPTTKHPSAKAELAVVNEYMKSQGFDVPGSWTFLTETMAEEDLALVIHKDMAYDAPMNDKSTCVQVAQSFVRLFDPESALFLSNGPGAGVQQSGDARSWEPMTTATFDRGVIGFDGRLIAYFWFEDED